ncbi:hypothetical protein Pfo_005094 [Paulownia fortunei]|nr:hypothetical protein Pfo_005094 [Paulownia fortunei]
MALRRMLGFCDGELTSLDAKPLGGALGFWILCRLSYGPRITVPQTLRWAACGAVSMSTTAALLVRP